MKNASTLGKACVGFFLLLVLTVLSPVARAVESENVTIPINTTPYIPKTYKHSQAQEAALYENFRWFENGNPTIRGYVQSALNGIDSLTTEKDLTVANGSVIEKTERNPAGYQIYNLCHPRASSASEIGAKLQKLYKQGQGHNPSAAEVIDNFSDEEIFAVAHKVFEEKWSLQICEQPAPALSATCKDLEANLQWIYEQHPIAETAIAMVESDPDWSDMPLWCRAAVIRRWFFWAEHHNSEVACSILFISDELLVKKAKAAQIRIGGVNPFYDLPTRSHPSPPVQILIRLGNLP